MTTISATGVIRQRSAVKPSVRSKDPSLARRLPVLLLFLPPALLLFTIFVILPMGEGAW